MEVVVMETTRTGPLLMALVLGLGIGMAIGMLMAMTAIRDAQEPETVVEQVAPKSPGVRHMTQQTLRELRKQQAAG